jgi:hypothetical protein
MDDGMIDDSVADARLRELYGRALRTGGTRGVADPCVSPEEVLALVRKELPEERRLEVLDHVMACHDCRREFDMLRAIEAAGGSPVVAGRAEPQYDAAPVAPVAPAPLAGAAPAVADPKVIDIASRRRVPWRRVVPIALAASVLVAVGLQLRRGGDTAPVFRGGNEAVTAHGPAGDVAVGTAAGGAPLVFGWRPVADASRYELEVMDGEGSVVYSASTSDSVINVPARDAAERFRTGVEYRWWVRAVTPGDPQPRSALRSFRLRRE